MIATKSEILAQREQNEAKAMAAFEAEIEKKIKEEGKKTIAAEYSNNEDFSSFQIAIPRGITEKSILSVIESIKKAGWKAEESYDTYRDQDGDSVRYRTIKISY